MTESREVLVAKIAEMLEAEFYETLEDAAGIGEAYDYEAFARRIVRVALGEGDGES